MYNEPISAGVQTAPATPSLQNTLEYIGGTRARMEKARTGIFELLYRLGFDQPAPAAAAPTGSGQVAPAAAAPTGSGQVAPARDKTVLEALGFEAMALADEAYALETIYERLYQQLA